MSADGRAAGEHTATDWRAAIDRGDVDAVASACPTTCTPPAAIAAAEAGKIVLCEKSLSLSLNEAIAMNGVRRVPRLSVARERFRPDFADALEVQRVLDAIQRSATTAQWVEIA